MLVNPPFLKSINSYQKTEKKHYKFLSDPVRKSYEFLKNKTWLVV